MRGDKQPDLFSIIPKNACQNCKRDLEKLAWHAETLQWVTPGKFPEVEFCGPKCADQWKAKQQSVLDAHPILD